MTHVFIDGDIVAYRAAYHAEKQEFHVATGKADELIERILSTTLFVAAPHEYTVYLTGKGNFRFDIAKSYEYKGNRKASEKPIWLSGVRDHMVEKWNAIVSEGEEADDLIAIAATKYGKDAVIASIDKDMLQVPCRHYNFGRGEWYTMDEFEGLKFFYKQILTGDTADNIIGLYRVGSVKADKMLEHCKNENDLWETVVKAYDGDVDRVIENARLLWLRREEGQLWQPPESREA